VCVVLGDQRVEGMTPADLAAAWSVAQRAAGIHATLVTPGSRAGCGTQARVVASVDRGGGVSLSRPSEAAAGVWRLALAGLAPRDRSRELARALATAARDEETVTLAPVTGVTFRPSEPVTPPSWRFGLALGGTWEPALGTEPTRLGGDVELRTATLGERLQLGLRVGWRPAVDATEAAIPTEVSALRSALVAGWGWRLGPLEARLGSGLELTWRRATSHPPTRLSAVTIDDLAMAVPLEARLTWSASRALAVEAAVGGRVFLGGASRTWLGDGVVDVPVGGLDVAVRLCWWWGR